MVLLSEVKERAETLGAVERTLVILKPDAVQRGLVGEIISRLERRGLKIVAMRLHQVDREQGERHYAEHQGKGFYASLVEYISSGPVVSMVIEGPEAISVTRTTVGATKPGDATPGTIRGDFGLMIGRNLVHASDGAESAIREADLFFEASEIVGYARDIDRWILED